MPRWYSRATTPCVLVTGAHGCIGAWVVRELVERGERVVLLDQGGNPQRLLLLLDAAQVVALDRVEADVTDLNAVEALLDSRSVSHVIHLAALQVPFCRADPVLGARVNVVGTVNVFEAARRADRVEMIVQQLESNPCRGGVAGSRRDRDGSPRWLSQLRPRPNSRSQTPVVSPRRFGTRPRVISRDVTISPPPPFQLLESNTPRVGFTRL